MRIASIIGGFIATMCYILWYDHVYHNWPHVNALFGDLTHIIIYSALSLSLFTIGSSEVDRVKKWFGYYAVSEFWAFLVLIMIYNTFIYNAEDFKWLGIKAKLLWLNIKLGY